jgi:hypothetical protein
MPDPLADNQGDPMSAGAIGGMMEGFERETAPLRQQQQQAAAAPLPKRPQFERASAPPSANIGNDAALWLAAATALGGIAGAMTRRGTTNALAAFTGTLEGLKEGNQQKFENNYKIWEAQARQVQQNNDAELTEYKAALENRQLDERQRSIQIQIIANKYRNQFMAGVAQHAAQTGDFPMVAAAFDAFTNQNSQSSDAIGRIAQAAQARKDKMEQMQFQRETQYGVADRRATMAEEDDAGIERRVDAAIAGDPKAAQGLRAGTPNEAKYQARLAAKMKEQNLTAQDLIKAQQQYAGGTSGARSLGTRLTNLESVIRSTNETIPLALAASDKVPRVGILSFAQAQQLMQTQLGDPALKDFVGKNLQLAELWARAMKGPGVLDVGLQERAFNYLSTAQSKGSYRAAVQSIYQSMQTELSAQKKQQAGEPLTDMSKLFGEPAQPPPQGGRPTASAAQPAARAAGGNPARALAQKAVTLIPQMRAAGYSDEDIKQFLRQKGKEGGIPDQQVEQFLNANIR